MSRTELQRRCFALSKQAVLTASEVGTSSIPVQSVNQLPSDATVGPSTLVQQQPYRFDGCAVPRRVATSNARELDGGPRWARATKDFNSVVRDATPLGLAAQRAERQTGVAVWEGHASWPRHTNAQYEDLNRDIFASTTMMNSYFVDRSRGYCRLCDEPVANLTTHSGYWDHCNLLIFLRVCASFQRRWSCAAVRSPSGGGAPYAALVTKKFGGRLDGTDAASADREAQRRREHLRAVLVELSANPNPAVPVRGVLKRSLQGTWGWAMGGMGERMFRATVGRIIVPLLPPMSAQMQTRFQQKCWGRKNLEMLYDALEMGRIEESFGMPARTEKNDKGSLMRQLVAELLLVQPSGALHGGADDAAEPRPGSEYDLVRILNDMHLPTEVKPPVPTAQHPASDARHDVRELLASWAVHQIAFELVFIMTAHYVGRATALWDRFGNPCLAEMRRMGFAEFDDTNADE